MAIIQCEHGHYYDDVKNITCPYCVKLNSGSLSDDEILREQLTVFKKAAFPLSEGQKTQAYGEHVLEGDKTISLFSGEALPYFTVGWLVCMNGPVKGKSYTLHRGRNFAGRSVEMDLVFSDDLRIAREKHFSIVYDPKNNQFFVVAGTGRTYLNGIYLKDGHPLIEGDKISAGESDFIFIPFCKGERTW